jgi:hypothetical protein
VIPEGVAIVLDTATAPLTSIKISGILQASPRHDAAMTADWLMVDEPGHVLKSAR